MNLTLLYREDKVAVVTGTDRGIGKAIALGLADVRGNVVVAAQTLSDIEATISEILVKKKRFTLIDSGDLPVRSK